VILVQLPTRRSLGAIGAAAVLALAACAWGPTDPGPVPGQVAETQSGPGPEPTPTPDPEPDTEPEPTPARFTPGSPVVTPTALEREGNPLGEVIPVLEAWISENCSEDDCLEFVLEPSGATAGCVYAGSDPGPEVEVPWGTRVILLADCDVVNPDTDDGEDADDADEDTVIEG
jgi:hypothetical protein